MPYISKVTGVPMVDLATRVMVGETLRDLGYGTGLTRQPPYSCVKVPVFSFEKLLDANSILGPEMKSTGEVLGVGRTLPEALFKGLTAAGFSVPDRHDRNNGVLISVETHDYQEILNVAKKFHDIGLRLYATSGTAQAIASLGIEVTPVKNAAESDEIFSLMEEGKLSYIIYTGAIKDETMGDFTLLHKKAMQERIPCLTSADTASALADMIVSRYNADNTELVDINHMRKTHETVAFTKMQDGGNDYIFIENFDGRISAPESLCVTLCERHTGIGADGIVLIEKSETADARMRTFNSDGSFGKMAGNNIRCIAKYLYDRGFVKDRTIRIESNGIVHETRCYLRNGKVSSVAVDMGHAVLEPALIPVITDRREVINVPQTIAGMEVSITCLSVGNPHCVVFLDEIDALDLSRIGPLFEHYEKFPDRINTEFVRVVDPSTIRIRVYERGNGETLSCGTGACAAAAAAVINGYCSEGAIITVKTAGGELKVRYDNGQITLFGGAQEVFSGTFLW